MKPSAFFDGVIGKAKPEILEDIAGEVRQVEAELRKTLQSQVPVVSEVGLHTLRAGGKRLRPAFLVLSAKATGLPYEDRDAMGLGVCMELIHMASLIHDDVIDHAATRRGRETANAAFGSTVSILSGDIMLAKAMGMLSNHGTRDITDIVAKAVIEMTEGEVTEVVTRGVFDLGMSEHLEILRMKTASFFQACCETGAKVAQAPEETHRALGMYGHHIGMAFQIVDDLLDYRGDQAKTGKPQATDFREGCVTLPLIFLRDKLSDGEREVVKRKFGNGVSDDEVHMICNWMEARGCFQQTVALAQEHREKALTALSVLPDNPGREMLAAMAELVVVRES
jgi:octaprenyl-diphosphate synthase